MAEMDKEEGLHETIKASELIDKMLDSTHALVSTINKLENSIEHKRCSFQSFAKDKILEHQTTMESLLAKLSSEVRKLTERVVILEISNVQRDVEEGGIVDARARCRRTHRTHNMEDIERGSR